MQRSGFRVALAAAVATLGLAPTALADGTETLGTPSVSIASGTRVVAAGVGMEAFPNTPNSFSVNLPAGSTVQQVLLYWEGHYTAGIGGPDASVSVNGNGVAGTSIGGPTLFYTFPGGDFVGMEFHQAYRADITGLGLVAAGSSTLTVSDMSFGSFLGNSGNDGAGVLVVYTPPDTAGTIGIRDGLDLAYSGFASPLDTTVPQTFAFAASASSRSATISSLAGSVFNNDPVAGFRPNQLRVTFNLGGTGDVTFDNPWQSLQGINLDASNLGVTIPAGATQMTVQALSGGPGGGTPASFAWIGTALTIVDTPPPPPPPPPPPGGEGCTPGYWKNHTSSWGPTGYSTSQTLASVFSNTGSLGSSTLLQALSFSGGSSLTAKKQILLRAAVASLLNSAHSGVDFDLTTAQVISQVNAALASNNADTILALATSLDIENNSGCPLN
jgi:hypothetical protein